MCKAPLFRNQRLHSSPSPYLSPCLSRTQTPFARCCPSLILRERGPYFSTRIMPVIGRRAFLLRSKGTGPSRGFMPRNREDKCLPFRDIRLVWQDILLKSRDTKARCSRLFRRPGCYGTEAGDISRRERLRTRFLCTCSPRRTGLRSHGLVCQSASRSASGIHGGRERRKYSARECMYGS